MSADSDTGEDDVRRALARIEALLSTVARPVARILARGLGRPADHRKLWWAKSQLRLSIPRSLRALYGWHDGQDARGGLFDRVLVHELADNFGVAPAQARGTFLSLARLVATGPAPAEIFDAEFANRQFGPNHAADYLSYAPGRFNGATPTDLLPFGWLAPLEDEPFGTEREDFAEVGDHDGLVAVDVTRGAVVIYEPAHEGFEEVFVIAPSLGEWLHEIATKLEAGAIPLPEAPSTVKLPQQRVDAGAAFLEGLVEANVLELAENADRGRLAAKARKLLRTSPRAAAAESVVAWLFAEPAIAEIFVEEDALRVLAEEYTGK